MTPDLKRMCAPYGLKYGKGHNPNEPERYRINPRSATPGFENFNRFFQSDHSAGLCV
jgi:hypothetical protein